MKVSRDEPLANLTAAPLSGPTSPLSAAKDLAYTRRHVREHERSSDPDAGSFASLKDDGYAGGAMTAASLVV
jgi:hypothetical protein